MNTAVQRNCWYYVLRNSLVVQTRTFEQAEGKTNFEITNKNIKKSEHTKPKKKGKQSGNDIPCTQTKGTKTGK